ncbi:MAG: hypothetical protein Edafosvirus9_31 [Edafosvirus sp.]|uniref:Uncharacterized protein n=1 Tax=Edafosvirus sp. TaxID=2487765 RepID=A0A3G4ZTU3_9VIRU|nr:MAG: hypothetical protein Edafosvirus9_31 [Edafosvirus sp.]
MSCVWNGIISALKLNMRPLDLLQLVQEKNIETVDVVWNNQELTKQNYTENMERIKSISPREISCGYDCSSCDPLLLLIAQIFNVSIIHNYNNVIINYTNKKYPYNKINVASNNNHFWNH